MNTLARKLTIIGVAAAALVAAISACSYSAVAPDILLTVNGVPPEADHATVTITDSSSDTKTFQPRIQPNSGTISLAFPFALPSSGTVTLQVQAFDVNDDIVGDGTVSSATSATPPITLTMALGAVASDGSFGARCALSDAGVQSCGTSLTCLQYQGATARGVCSQPCTTTCPAAPAPAASCLALPADSGTNFCQWECDQADAGTPNCPPGLTCQTATGTTKKFCQP